MRSSAADTKCSQIQQTPREPTVCDSAKQDSVAPRQRSTSTTCQGRTRRIRPAREHFPMSVATTYHKQHTSLQRRVGLNEPPPWWVCQTLADISSFPCLSHKRTPTQDRGTNSTWLQRLEAIANPSHSPSIMPTRLLYPSTPLYCYPTTSNRIALRAPTTTTSDPGELTKPSPQ